MPAPAFALVLDPMYNAAAALGYSVVGEIEFRRGSARPKDRRQVQACLQERRALCSGRGQFVIMSWSDRELPSRAQKVHSETELNLASRRARWTAQTLAKALPSDSKFALVNMASRKPVRIAAGPSASIEQSSIDIKSALEISGAAPTNQMNIGLFGEYAQSSKAVIWLNCLAPKAPFPKLARQQLIVAGGAVSQK